MNLSGFSGAYKNELIVELWNFWSVAGHQVLVIADSELEVFRFVKSLPFEMVDVLKTIMQLLKIFCGSLGGKDDFIG